MSTRPATPQAQLPTDPLLGTPYRTLAPLGRGSMGEVVEAEHIALAKRVVVKLLHRKLAHRSDLVARLELEGRALAHLCHPNIVAVTDLQWTPDGRPYLVMERLYGRTLQGERAARFALPVPEAVEIARQALAGLDAAHAAGIVHRDVKLENIFLCDPSKPLTSPRSPSTPLASRLVKLLDFGFAKVIDPRGPSAPTALAKGTADGVALGTPTFFAPEQAAFGAVDGRTDVYAMGAVVYILVTGRAPFQHITDLFELLHAQITLPPEPPSRYAPQPITRELDEAILTALAKRPEDRFPSAGDFAVALARAIRPKPRWMSTEPLTAAAAAATPFAPHPAAPWRPRWDRTEPLFPEATASQNAAPQPPSPPSPSEAAAPWPKGSFGAR